MNSCDKEKLGNSSELRDQSEIKRQKVEDADASCRNFYKEVDLLEWRNGYKCFGEDDDKTNNDTIIRRLPLIDLRNLAEYNRRHLLTEVKASSSTTGTIDTNDTTDTTIQQVVHLELSSLQSGERSCELPPRNVHFALLMPAGVGARKDVETLFFATESAATKQSRKPWLVKQVIIDSDDIWKQAKELGLLQEVKDNKMADDLSSTHKVLPLSRLWKPDRMVEMILLPLLKKNIIKASKNCSENPRNGSNEFVVWDLGCGSGRDVCYLAEELKYRFQGLTAADDEGATETTSATGTMPKLKVIGIDNHKGSPRRCIPLWKNRMVGEITESKLQDLKKLTLLDNEVKEQKGLMCLYAIRFLNRRLLEYIAKDAKLPNGCIFATSHFCKDESGEWNWDHPKEKSVLERKELSNLFSSGERWKVLHDELRKDGDGDHGRPLIHFIAEVI